MKISKAFETLQNETPKSSKAGWVISVLPVLLIVIAIFSLLTGCAKDEGNNNLLTIYSEDKIISYGMTRDQAEAMLGKPDFDGETEAIYGNIISSLYDLTITYKDNKAVACVVFTEGWTTDEGISVGTKWSDFPKLIHDFDYWWNDYLNYRMIVYGEDKESTMNSIDSTDRLFFEKFYTEKDGQMLPISKQDIMEMDYKKIASGETPVYVIVYMIVDGEVFRISMGDYSLFR